MTSSHLKPLTIAVVCPVVRGHANIHVAYITQLLSLEPTDAPPINIHVLSDEPLRNRVESLPIAGKHTLTFHSLSPTNLYADLVEKEDLLRSGPARLFAKGGLDGYKTVGEVIGVKPDVYLRYYNSIYTILEGLKDKLNLVVVDILFNMGRDACEKLGLFQGVIAPQASLDVSRVLQPGLRGFWKYPAFMTGFPYPVPPSLILQNILFTFCMIFIVVLHPRIRALDAARKEAGHKGTVMRPLNELPFVILPSILEMEYPHKPLPNASLVGPMLAPAPQLSESYYPELAQFIGAGPTILFNMGSVFKYTAEDVRRIADAISIARVKLSVQGNFRVLWKLPRHSTFAGILEERFNAEDKVAIRIEEWIEPPALAVLQHPNVVLSVHHGGANSTHEACYAGIPQIILPQWCDLYDFAVRVDQLGHGIYANKGAEAEFDTAQLVDAFVRILDGKEESRRMQKRAEEIGKACKAAGGVKKAAEILIDLAQRHST